MKKITLSKIITSVAFLSFVLSGLTAGAQQYLSPTTPTQKGRSPGVTVKLLSEQVNVKTYVLVFAAGDEIMSGLAEFADKYQVKSAHFTAIGDAQTAKIGWFDRSRNMFKVNYISTQSEITSLVGDIAMFNGKPIVHAHINLAAADGTVRGGHLFEAIVAPTLEVFVTVEPTTLYKKLSPEFKASIIDPTQ
jgi:predicted DNA-binding protein with PD1-like motif